MSNTRVVMEATNLEQWKDFMDQARESADDLRVVFGLIARTQFKFQRKIFQLKSKGKYEDLSTRPFLARWEVPGKDELSWKYFPGGYKQYKEERYGFAYPILFATGKLALSLLQPGGSNILEISPRQLVYGTRVTNEKGKPYPYFLQNGWTTKGGHKVPARPFLFFDDERLNTWKRIVIAHLGKSFSKPKGSNLLAGYSV